MKVSTIKSISNTDKSIVTEVNSSHLSKATFNEIQDDIVKTDKTKKAKKVSLKLPGNTRWGSILFNAESLLYNKKALRRLAITDGVILGHEIHTSILDENFWCGLLSFYELIVPIVKWITILKGDYCIRCTTKFPPFDKRWRRQ